MGNLIFGTTVIQGRTFDDIKIQTSKAGVPRPIIFGTARPIVGNIIATTAPRIVVNRDEQEGGKGGPSVEVENEEVFRTYAIRICEGPVTGVPRVWRNNELVYDRDSTDPTQIENNAAFLEKAEFFLGAFDQMPSAVMQSAFGINNVHGYRGTCYMVVDDENLTATGGAIPQYAFEVERCEGFALTSRPYALEQTEKLDIKSSVSTIELKTILHIHEYEEKIDISAAIESVKLISILQEYEGDAESIDISSSVNQIMLEVLVVQVDVDPESLDIGAELQSLALDVVVVEHEVEPEVLDIESAVDFITLEVV